MAGTMASPQWRKLVAVGLIVGDLSPRAIARFGRVSTDDAERALACARDAGLIVDGAVPTAHASALLAEIPGDDAADVHASVARYLIAQGPDRLLGALDHARAAGGDILLEEISDLADHAGRMSLSIGDYDSARQLFELADEATSHEPAATRAERLAQQARALEGLGRVDEARDVLARAFDLADLDGAADLAADIAVAYTFPSGWYAGDVRAAALLQRAAALNPSQERQVRIAAGRAFVDMRIPIPTGDDRQLAWVTRATVAQPDAELALAASKGLDPETRLLSLLSWRTTHRAPRHLELRREVSSEALDLAQRLREPGHQVDAAVMLAVDSLESGDRAQFDRALSVLRWITERDGNRRLHWHTYTVAAGISLMDGDLEAASTYRTLAREAGISVNSPGWYGADLLLLAQELLAAGDLDLIRAALPADNAVELSNPIGRAVVAYLNALLGEHDVAERFVRVAMRQIDEEASMLLLCSRIAAVAAEVGLRDVMDEMTRILTPYAHLVAVDSNAWWCEGPVSLTLALLAHGSGDLAATRTHLRTAETIASAIGDARSLRRIADLRAVIGPHHHSTTSHALGRETFTDRELQVLRMIASGRSNPEIAKALSYSPSTIRNDATALYRKLGARTRAEAAAKAIALGLV